MSTKFGKCPACPPESRTVRLYGVDPGYCAYHPAHPEKRPVAKRAKREELAAAALENLERIGKNMARAAKLVERGNLSTWFALRIAGRSPVCEEPGCGARLPTGSSWRVRATIAHIVPKRHFRSVQLHEHNHLDLCQEHHDRYDRSWDDARQMGVWPLAVARFRHFAHLISEPELRHLPEELRRLTNR